MVQCVSQCDFGVTGLMYMERDCDDSQSLTTPLEAVELFVSINVLAGSPGLMYGEYV